MPLYLQSRLLRVLSEREVLPVGSARAVKVDIRIISATHFDLQARIAEGKFREDLSTASTAFRRCCRLCASVMISTISCAFLLQRAARRKPPCR